MTKPHKATPQATTSRGPSEERINRAKPSSLLVPAQPLVVIPELAALIGLSAAIVLQQIHFWLERATHESRDGHAWIYNNFEEWQADFPFWKLRHIRRIMKTLIDLRLVRVAQVNKSRGDRTNWYSINYDEVEKLRPRQQEIAKERKETRTRIAIKRRFKR